MESDQEKSQSLKYSEHPVISNEVILILEEILNNLPQNINENVKAEPNSAITSDVNTSEIFVSARLNSDKCKKTQEELKISEIEENDSHLTLQDNCIKTCENVESLGEPATQHASADEREKIAFDFNGPFVVPNSSFDDSLLQRIKSAIRTYLSEGPKQLPFTKEPIINAKNVSLNRTENYAFSPNVNSPVVKNKDCLMPKLERVDSSKMRPCQVHKCRSINNVVSNVRPVTGRSDMPILEREIPRLSPSGKVLKKEKSKNKCLKSCTNQVKLMQNSTILKHNHMDLSSKTRLKKCKLLPCTKQSMKIFQNSVADNYLFTMFNDSKLGKEYVKVKRLSLNELRKYTFTKLNYCLAAQKEKNAATSLSENRLLKPNCAPLKKQDVCERTPRDKKNQQNNSSTKKCKFRNTNSLENVCQPEDATTVKSKTNYPSKSNTCEYKLTKNNKTVDKACTQVQKSNNDQIKIRTNKPSQVPSKNNKSSPKEISCVSRILEETLTSKRKVETRPTFEARSHLRGEETLNKNAGSSSSSSICTKEKSRNKMLKAELSSGKSDTSQDESQGKDKNKSAFCKSSRSCSPRKQVEKSNEKSSDFEKSAVVESSRLHKKILPSNNLSKRNDNETINTIKNKEHSPKAKMLKPETNSSSKNIEKRNVKEEKNKKENSQTCTSNIQHKRERSFLKKDKIEHSTSAKQLLDQKSVKCKTKDENKSESNKQSSITKLKTSAENSRKEINNKSKYMVENNDSLNENNSKNSFVKNSTVESENRASDEMQKSEKLGENCEQFQTVLSKKAKVELVPINFTNENCLKQCELKNNKIYRNSSSDNEPSSVAAPKVESAFGEKSELAVISNDLCESQLKYIKERKTKVTEQLKPHVEGSAINSSDSKILALSSEESSGKLNIRDNFDNASTSKERTSTCEIEIKIESVEAHNENLALSEKIASSSIGASSKNHSTCLKSTKSEKETFNNASSDIKLNNGNMGSESKNVYDVRINNVCSQFFSENTVTAKFRSKGAKKDFSGSNFIMCGTSIINNQNDIELKFQPIDNASNSINEEMRKRKISKHSGDTEIKLNEIAEKDEEKTPADNVREKGNIITENKIKENDLVGSIDASIEVRECKRKNSKKIPPEDSSDTCTYSSLPGECANPTVNAFCFEQHEVPDVVVNETTIAKSGQSSREFKESLLSPKGKKPILNCLNKNDKEYSEGKNIIEKLNEVETVARLPNSAMDSDSLSDLQQSRFPRRSKSKQLCKLNIVHSELIRENNTETSIAEHVKQKRQCQEMEKSIQKNRESTYESKPRHVKRLKTEQKDKASNTVSSTSTDQEGRSVTGYTNENTSKERKIGDQTSVHLNNASKEKGFRIMKRNEAGRYMSNAAQKRNRLRKCYQNIGNFTSKQSVTDLDAFNNVIERNLRRLTRSKSKQTETDNLCKKFKTDYSSLSNAQLGKSQCTKEIGHMDGLSENFHDKDFELQSTNHTERILRSSQLHKGEKAVKEARLNESVTLNTTNSVKLKNFRKDNKMHTYEANSSNASEEITSEKKWKTKFSKNNNLQMEDHDSTKEPKNLPDNLQICNESLQSLNKIESNEQRDSDCISEESFEFATDSSSENTSSDFYEKHSGLKKERLNSVITTAEKLEISNSRTEFLFCNNTSETSDDGLVNNNNKDYTIYHHNEQISLPYLESVTLQLQEDLNRLKSYNSTSKKKRKNLHLSIDNNDFLRSYSDTENSWESVSTNENVIYTSPLKVKIQMKKGTASFPNKEQQDFANEQKFGHKDKSAKNKRNSFKHFLKYDSSVEVWKSVIKKRARVNKSREKISRMLKMCKSFEIKLERLNQNYVDALSSNSVGYDSGEGTIENTSKNFQYGSTIRYNALHSLPQLCKTANKENDTCMSLFSEVNNKDDVNYDLELPALLNGSINDIRFTSKDDIFDECSKNECEYYTGEELSECMKQKLDNCPKDIGSFKCELNDSAVNVSLQEKMSGNVCNDIKKIREIAYSNHKCDTQDARTDELNNSAQIEYDGYYLHNAHRDSSLCNMIDSCYGGSINTSCVESVMDCINDCKLDGKVGGSSVLKSPISSHSTSAVKHFFKGDIFPITVSDTAYLYEERLNSESDTKPTVENFLEGSGIGNSNLTCNNSLVKNMPLDIPPLTVSELDGDAYQDSHDVMWKMSYLSPPPHKSHDLGSPPTSSSPAQHTVEENSAFGKADLSASHCAFESLDFSSTFDSFHTSSAIGHPNIPLPPNGSVSIPHILNEKSSCQAKDTKTFGNTLKFPEDFTIPESAGNSEVCRIFDDFTPEMWPSCVTRGASLTNSAELDLVRTDDGIPFCSYSAGTAETTFLSFSENGFNQCHIEPGIITNADLTLAPPVENESNPLFDPLESFKTQSSNSALDCFRSLTGHEQNMYNSLQEGNSAYEAANILEHCSGRTLTDFNQFY